MFNSVEYARSGYHPPSATPPTFEPPVSEPVSAPALPKSQPQSVELTTYPAPTPKSSVSPQAAAAATSQSQPTATTRSATTTIAAATTVAATARATTVVPSPSFNPNSFSMIPASLLSASGQANFASAAAVLKQNPVSVSQIDQQVAQNTGLSNQQILLQLEQNGHWPLAHFQAQQTEQQISIASIPTSFSGTPAQIAVQIMNAFLLAQQAVSLPTDGLEQVFAGLSSAMLDPNAMTQKMIGLAESLLRNGPSGGTDGVILDYTAAKLALEVAEQPDNAKHGLSELATMPDNGSDTYNIVITPSAPDGIGSGYAVLIKKETGTFLSQALGVVDTIVTPIVDIAAFFQPELIPFTIALNVIQGAQELANGNDLAGILSLAAAAAGGFEYYQNSIVSAADHQILQIAQNGLVASSSATVTQLVSQAVAASNLAGDASLVIKGISITQGIIGAVQGAQQGDALAAISSALGALGSAISGFNQSAAMINGTTQSTLLTAASRDTLFMSGLAGAAAAAGGGNVLQAFAALTSAAEAAGLTPSQIEQALLSGIGGATSSGTGGGTEVASSGAIAGDIGGYFGSSSDAASFALPESVAKAAGLFSVDAGSLGLGVAVNVLMPVGLGGGQVQYSLGNGVSANFTADSAGGYLTGTDAVTGVPFTIPIAEDLSGVVRTSDGTAIGAVNGAGNLFLNQTAVNGVLAGQAIAMAPVNLGSNLEGFSTTAPLQQLPGFEANIVIPTILSTPSNNPLLATAPGFSVLPQSIATLGSILSTPADQSLGQLGIIFAARPTSQQSEQVVGSFLGPDFIGQVSYLGGVPTTYGAPGSVRPDFSSADGMITYEVKNYNLNNISGMTTSIGTQAIARAANLPPGAVQNVVIDVTGQTITATQKQQIYDQIVQKSNGIIPESQVRIINSDN